ncbi:Protein of unknown function [Amycolatopsis xylanica]|uniref:Parallel beta-helix repeat (Two copies) n=1 Tax=Amycolatopsis xylanica TaxID=589385 RepID=A0A1H2SNU7_9PSEU|nr:right-handed parallel beta-helix repeat-containing protein [Amycolatopsis xylanica]SDW33280.1 Protein of unknown function [Amycolatopsis xylanica]
MIKPRWLIAGAVVLAGVVTSVVVLMPRDLPATRPGGGAATPAAVALPATDYPVPDGALVVSPTGDDAAAGTVDKPLRTVAAAVKRAPSGGTVVLRAGTYRETVGQVSKRLTLQPYPREQAWLKGSVEVTGWAKTGKGWRHGDWAPQLCQTCFTPEIIDPEYPLAGSPDMVFVDGAPLKQVSTEDEVGPGRFFADRKGHALVIGDAPDGRLVEGTVFDRLLQFDSANAAGSVFRGLGVAQYGSNQDYGKRGAMVVVNAPDVTIENATFAWSASSGAAVFQPGGTVSRSSFVDNGLVGLVANRADNLRLTENGFEANNQEHFALTGEAIGAAGAKITRTQKPYVADNRFVDNIGSGWWCDLGCTDATVIRNLARGNAGNGLYYEVSSRALIASNVLVGNRTRGLKISSSDHVRVFHNTFTGNQVALGVYNDKRDPDPFSSEHGLSWLTTGTVLVNNLFAHGEPVIESADYKDDPAKNPPFVSESDGNAFLRSGDGILVGWYLGGGRTANYGTARELFSATGRDEHSLDRIVTSSPFHDPDHGDYSLRPDAPGVRAGRPLPGDIAAVLGITPLATPNAGVLSR